MQKKKILPRERLARDFWLIVLSVVFAVYLVQEDVIPTLLSTLHANDYVVSFIAGMFFTSLFTVAPAGVTLVELAQTANMFGVAFFGAAGAVVGDVLLVSLIRGAFAKDMGLLISKSFAHRVLLVLRSRYLHWTLPIAGAVLIASPLPDEIGLAMLGISSVRLSVIIPLSFVANLIGILFVVVAGAALVG